MHASIWLKFETRIGGLKENIRINFGINLINIEGIISGFIHKSQLNLCHAYRVNRFEEQAENWFVARLNIRGVPYSLARACDRSAISKTISRQFGKKPFTQQIVQLHSSQRVYWSNRPKYPCTQFSQNLQRIQLHSRFTVDKSTRSVSISATFGALIDISQNHLNSAQQQPGCKKRCCPVQNDQCEKVVKSKGAAKKWL